jgi:hypothetical protein
MKTNSKLKAVQRAVCLDKSVSRPMLSLEESKGMLNQHEIVYTDEEILVIREFMYCIAEITTSHYQRIKENSAVIIPITQISNDETKSIPIHSRKHRRAG